MYSGIDKSEVELNTLNNSRFMKNKNGRLSLSEFWIFFLIWIVRQEKMKRSKENIHL